MLRCDNCPATTRSSRQVAEFGFGWRLWSGTTVGGTHKEVTLCPVCAGVAADPGWGVTCRTCDWVYDPEWDGDGEGSLDEKQAWALAADHECEPDAYAHRLTEAAPRVVTVQPLAGVL